MYKLYIPTIKAIQQPPSVIYEIVKNTLYTNESKIIWPQGAKARITYVLIAPLTHMQWLLIPNPMSPGRQNLYPVSLFMSMLFIFAYSYIIVWFTYVITTAYDLHFSILPMVLYPFGIALRDYKKFKDMTMSMAQFKKDISDQKLSLAETFSGPIFQITGLMGLTWTLYIGFLGADYVQFLNNSIQFQMPLLIVVVLIKYIILALSKYKTSSRLFFINLGGYTTFLVAVILIDYYEEFFG